MSTQATQVEVEGRTLRLSNLDKVLYPESGFTKGQVIDYYARIAPALLTHLRGRPLTLKRYPDGVDAHSFYEKNCPKHRPDWVRTAPVKARSKTIHYCVADDLPTLTWVANLASLELHTSLSLADAVERPTMMVFDLDPGAPATIVECSSVALDLRTLFDSMDLECFAKTSGSKGLQVYVPLNTEVTYDQTKGFSRKLGQLLAERDPKRVTAVMKKEVRKGKVFVDWSQNDRNKTTVCAYALRAREQPTVSTPVSWEEVEELRESGDPGFLRFVADEVVERFERDGDLFEPVATLEQKLPEL